MYISLYIFFIYLLLLYYIVLYTYTGIYTYINILQVAASWRGRSGVCVYSKTEVKGSTFVGATKEPKKRFPWCGLALNWFRRTRQNKPEVIVPSSNDSHTSLQAYGSTRDPTWSFLIFSTHFTMSRESSWDQTENAKFKYQRNAWTAETNMTP